MNFVSIRIIIWGLAFLFLFQNQRAYSNPIQENKFKIAEINVSNPKIKFINNQEQPLVGATVLVGYDKNSPFEGNELITDNSGSITIPKEWKTELPVTISSQGYVLTTFQKVPPAENKFKVSFVEGNEKIEIKGTTTGFDNLPTDGYVDFGLVLPAFNISELFHFDLSSVISPETDRIKVIMGKSIDVPSNLTLPKQIEKYIFSITLDKPQYRTYVRDFGTHSFFALHGKFPLQQVVDQVRQGSSIYELIKYFDFLEGGFAAIQANKTSVSQNIPINQFQFSKNIKVSSPPIPSDKTHLVLSLSEKNGGFVPIDLKVLKSNEQTMINSLPQANQNLLLHILTNNINRNSNDSSQDSKQNNGPKQIENPLTYSHYFMNSALSPSNQFNQLSLVFRSINASGSPTFLDTVPPPQLSNNKIGVSPPNIPKDIEPVSTYLILSDVEVISAGNISTEKRTRLWEIYTPGWEKEIQLPRSISFNKLPNHSLRWEVLFLGKNQNERFFVNENEPKDFFEFSEITHVSRNALNF